VASSFRRTLKRFDERVMKPFLISNYAARKDEIQRSKKFLKMNNINFDPTMFGRMTIPNQKNISDIIRSQYFEGKNDS
jgi:hypothetical protein